MIVMYIELNKLKAIAIIVTLKKCNENARNDFMLSIQWWIWNGITKMYWLSYDEMSYCVDNILQISDCLDSPFDCISVEEVSGNDLIVECIWVIYGLQQVN